MEKLLFVTFLLFLTSSASAGLVRLTASGTVNPNDLSPMGQSPFCCVNELKTFNWKFTSVFDLNDFYIPPYMSGTPSFISVNHESTTTIDGIAAPQAFNQGTEYSGQRHVLETLGFGAPYVSQFTFAMGVAFNQSSRFMVSDNLYLREMSLDGYKAGLYDTLNEASNLTTFTQALLGDTSQFQPEFRFLLGDANNPNDNIVYGSFWLNTIDHFSIEAVNVPEPNNGMLMILVSIGVMAARRRILKLSNRAMH